MSSEGIFIRPAASILAAIVHIAAGLDAVLVDIGEERPAFLPVRGAPPHEGARDRRTGQARDAARQGCVAVNAHRGRRGRSARRWSRDTRPADAASSRAGICEFAEAPPAGMSRAGAGQRGRTAGRIAPILSGCRNHPVADRRLAARSRRAVRLCVCGDRAVTGGGAIHFDEARAAVLIDVDTGSRDLGSAARSARRANLAAARMIARQLRLRQLGGGIVVDFAALDVPRERERLRQAYRCRARRRSGTAATSRMDTARPSRDRAAAPPPLDFGSDAGVLPRRHKSAATLAFEALRSAGDRSPRKTRHGIGAWLSFRLSRRHCADQRPRRSLPWKCVSGAGLWSHRQRAASPAPPIATRSLLTSWPCEPISRGMVQS